MQNSWKCPFVSDIWTAHFRPNYLRKKISMGYYQNKLRRSLCDFEQSNSTVAHFGYGSIQR